MKIYRFEDLEIWKESRELCKVVRELSKKKEFSKDFKLTSQINSSSGSVMDNIAEGYERDGNKEFIQFLSIAKGSNGETRSQAYRAFDAGFITIDEMNDILTKTESIKGKLNSFMKYLKNSDRRGNKYSEG